MTLQYEWQKYIQGVEKIMVLEHGYHGHTQTGIDIGDYKFNNPKDWGQKEFILKPNLPNAYNSKYRGLIVVQSMQKTPSMK